MLKRVTMDMANGRYTYFARRAMKIPELQKAIVAAIGTEVRTECQNLCTTTEKQQSVLRKTSAVDLKQFNWDTVVDELRSRAPVLYTILGESVHRYRRQHPKEVSQRSIGFAAAILLRERNKFMCAAQCVNSVVLHAGHASKMVSIPVYTMHVLCPVLQRKARSILFNYCFASHVRYTLD